ncbi:MAG TPA: His/Gly/Thr/Pro-type tRNA ligase C-terminal domain-containing protein, partial [Parafilimonas sp.]|nr:His/Gly/Thr/Pro-type tRNA ligase C-terminal domain-containing protein [Parafilimonas sp.]
ENARKGIEELEYILEFQSNKKSEIRNPKSEIKIDFTLARGLNYYTGIIFEIKAKNVQMGSIGGGGRYDDITGLFGVPNLPGVGISFGVDRIYDVMQELNLFPENISVAAQVLFFNLGVAETKTAYILMQQLRDKNISCEIYPEKTKFDKQFKYAERKNILYAVIIGSKEIETNTCIIKNIKTGEQQTTAQSDISAYSFT